ncbi:MAG: AmmeMemoRadiSam system protein B [Gammaproteobacteria bacterium]|nr:AmmeMemoRadiSam system protein B [Gammaproteobacteria bacterium]
MSFIDSDLRLSALPGGTRRPAVAGTFYPAEAAELRRTVLGLLAGARAGSHAPKGLIAPHAGYVYSGPIAAAAYATLASRRQHIRRVVLLGPAHRVYLSGLALPSVGCFSTPLGAVAIDAPAVCALEALPQITVRDDAHALEHSLEVHLPFLQVLLDDFTLVPLVVGDADPDSIAQVLETLWGGEETLIIVSSDLSHYHDYDTASRLDRATCRAVEELQWESIGPEQACGCMPINGLLALSRRWNLRIDLLDLRNSGDTAGPRDRVVGYGAFALLEPGSALTTGRDREALLAVARDSIRQGLATGEPSRPDPALYPAALRDPAALFVTLTLGGELRGCIGTTEASEPMVVAVATCAFNAAFRDPRFNPLSAGEFGRTALSVSLLSPKQALRFDSESHLLQQLRPGIHGLMIRSGERQAIFLPAVWESIAGSGDFLRELKRKAGMDAAEPPEQAWIYTAQSITELH